jgi:hypothetical protein
MRHLIGDTNVPVIFVEGIKKGDAMVSAARASGIDVLVVVISGVWNWLSNGAPIPDMYDIPIEERQVTVCFDSDVLTNPNVQLAAQRLAEHLISRGAKAWMTFLPGKLDGAKMGADDFFVDNGTFAKLRSLTRKYDPEDFAYMRLSRDERLRLAMEDLEHRFWAFEWKGMGGHSARDVALKLIEAARRYGKVVDDGVRVTKAQGPLAVEAKVSGRTLWKALNRLEEWGILYRDNEGREADKPGAFVLRANVSHYGRREGTKGETTQKLQEFPPRDLHLRAPRLRWSSPAVKSRRGLVRRTRMVRQGPPREPRPAIRRLGKIRGAIIDTLDSAGGTATLQEIADILYKKRPRDIRRRNLPLLEEAGIITVVGDVVSLTEDWLEALEAQRELGKEIEAEEIACKRYEAKSRAFRERHKAQPSYHYVNVGADGHVEDLRRADEPEEVQLEIHSLSPLAEAVKNYLEYSPQDACQPPGWIGTTLWAHELYLGKPTPAEIRNAIGELGGESYLRLRLEEARCVA